MTIYRFKVIHQAGFYHCGVSGKSVADAIAKLATRIARDWRHAPLVSIEHLSQE